MTAGAQRVSGHCRVVAGEKYLKLPVGGGAICAEIERAIGAQTPNARFRAEIRAQSPSRLSATLTVNGKALPEHKFAVMDAELSLEAVKRFARSLAIQAAEAAKP